MIRIFEVNLSGPEAHERALVLVGVGGMVLARGMDDQALADDFRSAAHKHIRMITGWGDGRGD